MPTNEELTFVLRVRDDGSAVLERFGGTLQKVASTTDKSGKEMRQWRNEVDKATGEARQMDRAIKSMSSSLNSLRNMILGTAGVYGLKKLAGGFLETASSMEQLRLTLDTLTKGRGEEWFRRLNEWAMKMPVNTQKAIQMFTMLQAMGLNPTLQTMTTLVDATAALGGRTDTLEGIARALGQMAAKGRVSAEELMQLTERGIPAYRILQEELGLTAAQVANIGKEAISSDVAIAALLRGMEQRYGGMSERIQSAWKGLSETLKSYWIEFQRLVMEAGPLQVLEAMAKNIVEQLDRLKEEGRLDLWAKDVANSVISVFEATTTALEVVINSIRGVELVFSGTLTSLLTIADKVLWIYERLQEGASFLLFGQVTESAKDVSSWVEGIRESLNVSREAAINMSNDLIDAIANTHQQFDALRQVIDETTAAIETTGEQAVTTQQQIDALTEEEKQAFREKATVLEEWNQLQQEIEQESTQFQIEELQQRYEAYLQYVDDKVAVEEWFSRELARLEAERSSEAVRLYTELFKATGIEEYAQRAIEAYQQVLQAEQYHWQEILQSTEDALALKEIKEQKFVESLYGILNETVRAEEDALNRRLGMVEEFVNERVRLESEAASRAVSLYSSSIGGRGGGYTSGSTISEFMSEYHGIPLVGETYAAYMEGRLQVLSPTSFRILPPGYGSTLREQVEVSKKIADNTSRLVDWAQRNEQREIERIQRERERQFTTLWGGYESFMQSVARRGWGLAEYTAEFYSLAGQLQQLLQQEGDRFDEQIDLLEQMLDVLFKIDQLEQKQLQEQQRMADNFASQAQSVDRWLLSLRTGELAPVQSLATWQAMYQQLYQAALPTTGTEGGLGYNVGDVSTFLSFAQNYLQFAKTYIGGGVDYTALYNQVVKDVEALGDLNELFSILAETGVGMTVQELEKLQEAFAGEQGLKGAIEVLLGEVLGLSQAADSASRGTESLAQTMNDDLLKVVETVPQPIRQTSEALQDLGSNGVTVEGVFDTLRKHFDIHASGGVASAASMFTENLGILSTKAAEAHKETTVTIEDLVEAMKEEQVQGAMMNNILWFLAEYFKGAWMTGDDFVKLVAGLAEEFDTSAGPSAGWATKVFLGVLENIANTLPTAIDAGQASLMDFLNTFTKPGGFSLTVHSGKLNVEALTNTLSGKFSPALQQAKTPSEQLASTFKDTLKPSIEQTNPLISALATVIANTLKSGSKSAKDEVTNLINALKGDDALTGALGETKTTVEALEDAAKDTTQEGVDPLGRTLQATETPFKNVIDALSTVTTATESNLTTVAQMWEQLAQSISGQMINITGKIQEIAEQAGEQPTQIVYQPTTIPVPWTSIVSSGEIVSGLGYVPKGEIYWVARYEGRILSTSRTKPESDYPYVIWGPGGQKGGLFSTPTIGGEAGPEWFVPTYEPERSQFLRDIGLEPSKVGRAIAKALMENLYGEGGGGGGEVSKPVHIHLHLDNREIARAVANVLDTDDVVAYKIRNLMRR